MVVTDYRPYLARKSQGGAYPLADRRVLPYLLPLTLGQWARLAQESLTHPYLSDVMQNTALTEEH